MSAATLDAGTPAFAAGLAQAHPSVKSLFLTRKQLCAVLGCSPPTLDRMRAAGKFGPQPVRIGVGTAGLRWLASEVEAWAECRTPGGGLMDAKQWAAYRAAKK